MSSKAIKGSNYLSWIYEAQKQWAQNTTAERQCKSVHTCCVVYPLYRRHIIQPQKLCYGGTNSMHIDQDT